MKICLYLEFYTFMGGFLYKNIGTGLLSSYKNQKRCLETLGLAFTESWDPSCDILQINTPWFYSLYVIHKARKLNKKVIIWSHVTAEDARQVFWFNKYFFGLIKKYLTYAYGKADMIFCPTQHTKNLLLAYGLPEHKLVVQSNGVDTTCYMVDEKKRVAERNAKKLEGLVIGTVGLVVPRKGVDEFLDLAQRFSDHPFIWFGKIYSKLMVKGIPKNLPPNVQFTGYVQDVVAAFNALDIFVFLSEEENQGMVILEAASLGLPILLRDLPAYRGWMVHDQNCLIAQSDAEAEQYLARLIADPGLRMRLGEHARLTAKSEDIRVLNQHLLAHYHELLIPAQI